MCVWGISSTFFDCSKEQHYQVTYTVEQHITEGESGKNRPFCLSGDRLCGRFWKPDDYPEPNHYQRSRKIRLHSQKRQ